MSAGPNFLVVGAAKSGTTSLCHYLRQHPQVFVAREKESHYFLFEDNHPSFAGPGDADEFNPLIITDRDRYERCFEGAGSADARGEASVYYLYRPHAFERALAYNPRMKFVAVLRDPVDRAFSAWAHMMRDGREPQPDFLSAVGEETRREAAGWSYGFSYESVGRYGAQIQAARAIVPEGQLHVMFYDDLVHRPTETMATLFDFLGVNQVLIDSSAVMNASGKPRLQALNSLLNRRNPVKEGLKRVLPYGVGNSVAHRLRRWNLTSVQMDKESGAALAARFDQDLALLATLLDNEPAAWLSR